MKNICKEGCKTVQNVIDDISEYNPGAKPHTIFLWGQTLLKNMKTFQGFNIY